MEDEEFGRPPDPRFARRRRPVARGLPAPCGHDLRLPPAAHARPRRRPRPRRRDVRAGLGLRRSRFRDTAGGSAAPWLFGIARNVLLESVRRGRLERAASQRLGIFERLDREPAEVEPTESWLDGLDEALASLPAGQREAIGLRVLHDFDYDDVARALTTTPSAARVRVSRGLATLRDYLTRMEA